MAHVVVRQLVKKYGELQVVHGIDFEIGDGEFVVLVGPSGCGKSTILRMIAGLESVSGGEIAINGRVVNDDPPRDRDIAMVFQDYALYPHMSVRQNLGFGLKMRNTPRAAIAQAVDKTAEILQIEKLLDRKPKELSGGQRQRVAIGRAIAREPRAVPVRRAALQSRRQAARRDAHADQAPAHGLQRDQRLRDARPDRGDDARRPHRGAARRPDRAGRHPRGPLFPAGQSLRRRLHRLADHELPRRRGWSPRTAACSSCRPAGRACRWPPARVDRYRPHAGKPVVLGIRPEDLTNTWTDESRDGSGVVPLDVVVEIAEPLGSDTLIFSRIGERRDHRPHQRRLGARRRLVHAPARPPEPHAPLRSRQRCRAVGRITGDRTGQSKSRGIGWEFVHVCIDDASRLAFSRYPARRESRERHSVSKSRGGLLRQPRRNRRPRHDRQWQLLQGLRLPRRYPRTTC